MSWLLDTCVLSEPTQKDPDAQVLSWLDAQEDADLYISALTVGEIRRGVARLPAGGKRHRLEQWVGRELLDRFAGRILAFDTVVADRWGRLQAEAEFAGKPLPAIDSLIAATALSHGLRLVTRNSADFAAAGVEVFDPWSGKYPPS